MGRKQTNNTMMNKYTSNFPEIHLIRSDNIWQAQRGSVTGNATYIEPKINSQASAAYQIIMNPAQDKTNYSLPLT